MYMCIYVMARFAAQPVLKPAGLHRNGPASKPAGWILANLFANMKPAGWILANLYADTKPAGWTMANLFADTKPAGWTLANLFQPMH